MNIYKEIFSALGKARINYLIVGGVAVNLYGYVRFTGDIDIILALDIKNLSKIDQLMHKLNYTERLPISIKELGDQKKLEEFIIQKGLKAYTYISSQRPELSLDIIIEESAYFKKYYPRRSTIKVWRLRLPVISLNDLISMKKKAARAKDLIDLEALLKLKKL